MHVVFDFSSVPKLKRFVIGARERQLHYVFTRLSRHVPRMRSLTGKTRYATTRITIFKDVAELNLLFNSNTEFDIWKMIAILRASPSLQKLYLETCSSEDMDRGELEHSEQVHKHLKQIEFAIYLLKHAISLERMVINPVGKYCSALRQPWDEGEREEAYRKLHEPDYPLNVSESLWDSTIKFKLFNVLGCALPFALLCLKLSVLACVLIPC
ncbi:hypothetical protein NC651_037881 [Populus alba x Populus x berolinensis]|nr:hypothetical protein NC651_037881 [Populus alba x Populus x berolinensis]